jgi:hypothetical protein
MWVLSGTVASPADSSRKAPFIASTASAIGSAFLTSSAEKILKFAPEAIISLL